MLNGYQRLLDDCQVFLTGLLTAAAYVAFHALIRDKTPPLLPLHAYLPSIGIIVFALMFALSQRRFSSVSSLATPALLVRELALGYLLALGAYASVAYAMRLTHLSRLYLLGGALLGGLAACAWHLGVFAACRWLLARGWNAKRVLLIGEGEALEETARMIQESRSLGLRVAGTMGLDGDRDIRGFLDSQPVDYALFTTYRGDPERVERMMLACQERGIRIWLRPDFIQRTFSGVEYLQDVPLLVFSMTPREGLGILLKRVLDVAGALLLLVLLAGPMLLLVLAIRLTSRGPALFKQRRVGLNGAEFDMYKFRSMVDGSGFRLKNEVRGPAFKMRRDPRVTPLGRVLRKYSLDELPQLWNVLKGEMSLVGPRPPLPSEVGQYHGWQRRRLSMRPGITGLWQVSGRNAIEFNDWVKLDLRYIDEWSLWLDLQIILRTIPAVLKGTGV